MNWRRALFPRLQHGFYQGYELLFSVRSVIKGVTAWSVLFKQFNCFLWLVWISHVDIVILIIRPPIIL